MNLDLSQNDLIIVLEIGGLGDFIMATPTLKAIRKYYPCNPIMLLVAERSIQLATDFSEMVIDNPIKIIPFRTTGSFLCRNINNLFNIKKIAWNKPKLLIDLSAIESESAAKRRELFINLFSSNITVGRNTDRRGFFYSFSSDEILFSKEHETDRKLNVLRKLGIDIDQYEMHFPIKNTSRQYIRSTIKEKKLESKTFIGINTGAYRQNRRWPIQNIIELISGLKKNSRHFIIFGGPDDKDFVNTVCQSINPQFITAVIGESFQKVGAWLEICKLFITNDTGLMHFAAALKIPTIALFGPENPHRYAPWGNFPKHIIKFYPNDKNEFTESNIFYENAIQMIKPRTVISTAQAYLKNNTFK